MRAISYVVFAGIGLLGPLQAEEPYHLFNPVPAPQLRPLSADRPDTTESPITVDAGHLQLEMSLLDYTRDGDLETYVAGAMNLKLGLLENTDLQMVFDLHTWGDEGEGFRDVTLRLKQNIWGNDGGKTALALMPFVKIPTGTELSNGEAEGGFIVPFSIDLADGLGVGLMAEVDWVYDGATGDYATDFVHTAVLGLDLTENLGLYTEYLGITHELGAYESYFSMGLTRAVGENILLDVGALAGLNRAAADFEVFTGMTVRF